jgi:hypothetical protein
LIITGSKEQGNNIHLFIHQEYNKGSDLTNHPIKLRIHHIGITEYGHNHIRQLIWHLNNIAQERERSNYIQKPSPEVDYSHFIMVAVLVMSESLEKRLRMAQQCLPVQSSQVQPLFHGFMFLRHLGEFLYRGFKVKPVNLRSRRITSED